MELVDTGLKIDMVWEQLSVFTTATFYWKEEKSLYEFCMLGHLRLNDCSSSYNET